MTAIDCPDVRGASDICMFLGYSVNSWKHLKKKLMKLKLLSYEDGRPVLNKKRYGEHSYNRAVR